MGESSDRELERLFDLDDAAGPARPIDASRSAAIVAAALRGAGFPPGGGSSGGSGGAAGAKSAIATRLALVASGAVLAIGAWLLVRTPAPAAELPAAAPAPVVQPVEPPPPAAAPASAAVAPGASEDEAAPEPPEPPEQAEQPEQGDAPTAPPSPPARTRTRPRQHARVEAPRTPAEAADLLARANAARLAHDWRAADALYRRVARGGGGNGLAAQTALVASAELHLEHLGDPAGAARRFRAALAGGAGEALAEDARWGLAESARAAGDAAAERRALDDFLAHHPASARAERARTRRAELGAAP
ncbi:MAG TPA: hypothetical protein VHW23_33725 [Kofleriaceae bacterium]|jgi:type IV secretory pathway VirB10-like protein|nr:hypothetical protein [Kofleriaceae bacterium]